MSALRAQALAPLWGYLALGEGPEVGSASPHLVDLELKVEGEPVALPAGTSEGDVPNLGTGKGFPEAQRSTQTSEPVQMVGRMLSGCFSLECFR